MDSTIWPSIGDVGTALIADETQRAAVRDQFKEQSTRLFCEKQEDMLVEAVILSSNGKEIDNPVIITRLITIGVKTAEFETEKAFEAHFEVGHLRHLLFVLFDECFFREAMNLRMTRKNAQQTC
jgi:hypothetical protein